MVVLLVTSIHFESFSLQVTIFKNSLKKKNKCFVTVISMLIFCIHLKQSKEHCNESSRARVNNIGMELDNVLLSLAKMN